MNLGAKPPTSFQRQVGAVVDQLPATLLNRSLDAISGASRVAQFSEPDEYEPEESLINGSDVAVHAREAARLIGVLVPDGEPTR